MTEAHETKAAGSGRQPAQPAAPTPGPWTIMDGYKPGIDAGAYSIIIYGEDEDDDAGIHGVTANERLANARLIAAAPATAAERDRLVKALEGVLSLDIAKRALLFLDKGIGTSTPLNAWLIARAALAAARPPQTTEGAGG